MTDNSKIFTRKKRKKYDEDNNQIDESKINNLKTFKNNSNYKGNELNTSGLILFDKRIRKQIAYREGREKIVKTFGILNKKTKGNKKSFKVFNHAQTLEEEFSIISQKDRGNITFKKDNSFLIILSQKKEKNNLIQNISEISILSTKKDDKSIVDQNISDFSILSTKKDDINIIDQNISDFSILSTKKDDINIIDQNISDFTILSKKKDVLEMPKSSNFIIKSKVENRNKTPDSLSTPIPDENLREISHIIELPETPKGLNNFALNCYMNSLLQCLYHIKGLRTSFIESTEFSPTTQKVCYYLSEVMKGLTYGNNRSFSPYDFKNTLGNINSLFKGSKGADVSDLYRTIVDSIISEIRYECPEDEEDDDGDNTNQEKYYTIAKKEVDENNPIIKELNYFFETIYNCPEGYKCYSIQNDTSIMFELLKISKWAKTTNLNLEKCFEYNYRIIENNEFYCSKCEGTHNDKSQDKIISLPKVLTIILNRGKGKQFTNKVDFDEIINIEEYVDNTFIDKRNKKYNYKLICVSTHLGSSSNCGHYIAYCFRENTNKYYCLNDESYRVVSFDDLKYGEPYILFYERIDDNDNK